MTQGPDVAGLRTRRVPVAVGGGYDVLVGEGLLAAAGSLVAHPTVALVTDATVATLHADTVEASLLAAGTRVTRLVVEPGETSKSVTVWADLLRRMARAGIDRRAAVVALGGGVVGDLAGFVAASYLRGVALYQVPTTLLAMVDASVGGKTGLDVPEGKNLVGAFWQPDLVIADVATLATLPEAEFRRGTVELVKHGYLRDPLLLDVIADDWRTTSDPQRLAAEVARSIAVKAAVVAADERERGERAYLNLGHTLAHALEAVTDLALHHGDAVAYGLLYAGLLARARGHADLVPGLRRLVAWLGPSPLPDVGFDALAPYIARDKKASGGKARFVLLRDVGQPYLADDVDHEEQVAAYRALKELVT